MDYKVRFIEEGVVHRAPPKGSKESYTIERIPVGTVKIMRPSSVNFRRARGKIEVLEAINKPVSVSTAIPSEAAPNIPKAPVRRALEVARAALDMADLEKVCEALKGVVGSEQLFHDFPDDARIALFLMVEDAAAGVDLTEHLEGAADLLKDAYVFLLPPSQRARYK